MKLFGSWQIFAIGSAFVAVADDYLRQARSPRTSITALLVHTAAYRTDTAAMAAARTSD